MSLRRLLGQKPCEDQMNEFAIVSEDGSTLRFFEPVYAATGWVDYCLVQLKLRNLQAQQQSSCLLIDPILGFFDEIAEKAKGWPDKLSASNIEGDIFLSATFSRTGYIEMDIVFTGFDGNWIVNARMLIPSGEMPAIAKNLGAFMRGSR